MLELSLSCDNLLCDALGRAPSAKLIVTFRNNRSVAYWRHLAQTEVAEVKSIKLGQLLGWSLLTPEVCSLNPVMINFHLQSIQSNKTIKITKRDPYSFEKKKKIFLSMAHPNCFRLPNFCFCCFTKFIRIVVVDVVVVVVVVVVVSYFGFYICALKFEL